MSSCRATNENPMTDEAGTKTTMRCEDHTETTIIVPEPHDGPPFVPTVFGDPVVAELRAEIVRLRAELADRAARLADLQAARRDGERP